MWKWTELKFYFLVLIVKFTLYIEIDHSSPSPVYPTIAIVFYAPSSLSFAFCALATNSSTQVPPWSTLDLNFLPIAVCFCFSLSFPPPTVLFFCRKTVNTQSRHSLLQIKKVTLVLIRERFDCNFNVVPSSSIVNTAGGWRPVTNEIFRRTQQLPLADSLCLSLSLSLSLSLFHFIHFFYFFLHSFISSHFCPSSYTTWKALAYFIKNVKATFPFAFPSRFISYSTDFSGYPLDKSHRYARASTKTKAFWRSI